MTTRQILASRRQAMLAALAGLAVAAAVPARAQARKLPQKTVQYVATSRRPQKCEGCTHFEAPNACKIVEGEIAPEGWCVSFAPKPRPAG